MDGIRSIDERQVQRYQGYRNMILSAMNEQHPGRVDLQADEYVVREPIDIEPAVVPFKMPDHSAPVAGTDRTYETRKTTILPGSHVHKVPAKGDEIRLSHNEREYWGTTPVPGLERYNEDFWIKHDLMPGIDIIYPSYLMLRHEETLTQREEGQILLGTRHPVLERKVRLDEWASPQNVTLAYDLETGELLKYEGPGAARI